MTDDLMHTLAQMAATIYASSERTPQAQRAAVKEAADLLRLCQEHIRGAHAFRPDDDGTVWDDGEGCQCLECQHPDCALLF